MYRWETKKGKNKGKKKEKKRKKKEKKRKKKTICRYVHVGGNKTISASRKVQRWID